MKNSKILLIYDAQCPACKAFTQVLRIRQSVGQLQLINAREPSPIMQELSEKGLDLDQGMVLKVDQQIYYGADALHALALMSSRSGFFNRLNYIVFQSKTLSTLLYPLLRAARNLLLKLLGKTKINNLDAAGNDKF